jgi:plastocyanin
MSINDKIMNKFTIYDKLIVLSFILAITLSIATVNGLTPVFGEITANMTNSHNIQVEVGGGNITYPLFGYNPQKIQIHVGDSVSWTGVSQMEEPHTVTFVKDKSLNTAPDVPFMVTNSSQFTPVPPNANSQPTIMPSNSSSSSINDKINNNNNNKPIVIVGANERANLANSIDKNGHVTMLDPSKPVVMDGTEKFVNSGIIVAKKFVNIYPGSTDSFTITFDKPGTYDYICVYHSTMGGQVVVK